MPVLFKYDVSSKAWKYGNTTIRKLKLFDTTWKAFHPQYSPKSSMFAFCFSFKTTYSINSVGPYHSCEREVLILFVFQLCSLKV